MTIADVKALTRVDGVQVVPDLADYDDHSEGWAEAEYRAGLEQTRSIAGYWEGEPGWVRIDVWPYNEVCVVLDGRVGIEDESGERREFGAGEAFLIPAGFSGVWHTLEPTRKIFVGVVADLSLDDHAGGPVA